MKLTIEWGNGAIDSYEVPESFTYREIKTMRQITGLEPAQFEAAIDQGNGDLAIALAVVSSARSGKPVDAELLYDLSLGSIMVEDDAERPTEAASDGAAQEQTLAAGGDQPS